MIRVRDDELGVCRVRLDRQRIILAAGLNVGHNQVAAAVERQFGREVLHEQRHIVVVRATGVVDDKASLPDNERSAIGDRNAVDLQRTESLHGIGAVIVDDRENVIVGRREAQRDDQVRVIERDRTSDVQLIVLRADRRAVEFDIEVRAARQRHVTAVENAGTVAGRDVSVALCGDR